MVRHMGAPDRVRGRFLGSGRGSRVAGAAAGAAAGRAHRRSLHADLVGADAAAWTPPAPFDAVLLDAPCSATGTIRRHPDVPHLKRPRDIVALAAQQDRLLDAARAMLRPGGRLLYAVYSLQPEEGMQRIAAALARLPLRHAPFAASEFAGLPEALTPAGNLRTHPGLWRERGGMDVFLQHDSCGPDGVSRHSAKAGASS